MAALVERVEPGGAVALLEHVLQPVVVGVGDHFDGVQDDVARLRATSGAFGLRRGRVARRRSPRDGPRRQARGDGVRQRRGCGRRRRRAPAQPARYRGTASRTRRRGVVELPSADPHQRDDEPDDEDHGHDPAEDPRKPDGFFRALLLDGAGQRRRSADDCDRPDPRRGVAHRGQVAAQAQLARHLERAGDGERLGVAPLADVVGVAVRRVGAGSAAGAASGAG